MVADGIELAALSDKFFHPLTADSQGVRLVRDHIYVARLLHEGTVVSGTPRCFFQLFPPEIATLEPSGRDTFKVASKTGAPGLLRITCGDLWKTIPIAPLDFSKPPSDAGGDDGSDAGDASLQGDAQ